MGPEILLQGFVHICQLAADALPSVCALCCGQGTAVVVRLLLLWLGYGCYGQGSGLRV